MVLPQVLDGSFPSSFDTAMEFVGQVFGENETSWDLLRKWMPSNGTTYSADPSVLWDWLPANTTYTAADAAVLLEWIPSEPDKQLIATAVAVSLVVLLLLQNWGLRRQQQRWNDLLKIEKRRTGAKVEDLTLRLVAREADCVRLKQELLKQERSALEEREKLDMEATQQLSDKDEDCRQLQAKLAEAEREQRASEFCVEELSTRLQSYEEGYQDHQCQILEQKLQAGQLKHTLAQREAQVKDLMQTNAQLIQQMEHLRMKGNKDSTRAEAFIATLNCDSDTRFSSLRQEGNLLRTSLESLLKQTQQNHLEDKANLNSELRRRDDRIKNLEDKLREATTAAIPGEAHQSMVTTKGGNMESTEQEPGCEQLETRTDDSQNAAS